jgi:hypothetical protein
MWRFGVFFSLDSRTLNKISIANALRLPTSQALVIRLIDLGVKRYRFLNSLKKNPRSKLKNQNPVDTP